MIAMIIFFCFSAAGVARNLMKPLHNFASPSKTEFSKSMQFLYRFGHAKVVLMLQSNTISFSIFRGISF